MQYTLITPLCSPVFTSYVLYLFYFFLLSISLLRVVLTKQRVVLFFIFSNTLRVTRAAALQGQDGGSTSTAVYVGKKGKDFEFSHVLPVKVEFVECSAKGQADGEAELTAVEQWLEKMT